MGLYAKIPVFPGKQIERARDAGDLIGPGTELNRISGSVAGRGRRPD
jgi:hypothetical protein